MIQFANDSAAVIDWEEDRTLRAVLVGMLREGRREVRAQAAGDERASLASQVVPHFLTAAILTFEGRSGAVDHMQTTRTELAP